MLPVQGLQVRTNALKNEQTMYQLLQKRKTSYVHISGHFGKEYDISELN